MDSSIPVLCQTCSDIDFSALVWPSSFKEPLTIIEPITLGTTQEIRDRKLSCKLCGLIATRLDEVLDQEVLQNPGDRCKLHFTTLEEEAISESVSQDLTRQSASRFLARKITVVIVPVAFSGFVGPVVPDRAYEPGVENPTKAQSTVHARSWALLYLQGCTNPIPTVDQLCNGSFELLAPPRYTRCSGRLRNDTINPLLYRHWLQMCRKNHGEDWSTQQGPIIENLRVIDVQDMAVRLAPMNCQYVVLSYCWGSAKTTLLTRENVHQFAQSQSLSLDLLPNTVADAIEVTRNAGIQYLWVDALCIIQDDPATLQSQIPKMAQIYAQGIFTIIAAAANCADDGLAGVQPGSRSVVKDVIALSDMNLITVPMDFINNRNHVDLRGSRWRSRAWTLQEELFSRRRLYFKADRVLWQCPSALYQEDTIKETSAVFVSDCGSEDYGFEWRTRTAEELDFRWYEKLVQDYSTRNLSFPIDTLNALAGLHEKVKKLSGVSFSWGHPEPWFARSLYWKTNHTCTRNAGTQLTTSPAGTEIRTPFPSWSWSAWIGKLDNDMVFQSGSDFVGSSFTVLIYRCTLDANLKPVPYRCINVADMIRYELAMSKEGSNDLRAMLPHDWVGEPRQIILPKVDTSAQPIDSGHLQFWSSMARAYIAHYVAERPYDRQPNDYVLLDGRGTTIAKDAKIMCTSMLDWNDLERYDRYPIPLSKASHSYTHGIHEIHAIAVERSNLDRIDVLVSVLIVVQEGTIFSRIGTVTVTNSQWLSLAPEWSLITLG